MTRGMLILLLSISCAAPVLAGGAHPSEWTVDDAVLAERASDWQISPDAGFAVWVRTEVKKVGEEEKPVSNLWISRLAAGQSSPLTRGSDRISSPRIAPDGRHVAFLSTRKIEGAKEGEIGETQIWALPLAGGEPFPVTRWVRSVQAFGWTGDAALVFASQEARSRREQERKEEEDTTIVVESVEDEPPVRLFHVALTGGKVRRLTMDDDWISSLSVAPDGKRAVIVVQQSLSYEFDEKVPPHTYLVDLATGVRARLFEGSALLPSQVRWSPDSRSFYFVNAFTRHPVYRQATIDELYYQDLDVGGPEKVGLDWERGVGSGYVPVAGGVVALLADGVRNRPARISRNRKGWKRQDLAGEHVRNLDDLVVSRDGSTVLYQHSSAVRPPQWHAARLDGAGLVDARQLTDLNPRYHGKPTGQVEVIRWKGAGGEEVEGLLLYPLDWREGERRPLILDIHGGPAGVDRDSWDLRWASPHLLWQQRGAFVLQVNYHGSSGYGLDWVESIGEGRYYDLEVPDIEAGVDEVIRRGLADPERLGSTGWSNGGILTAALIVHTRRYKAASIGAADVEWFSDWGNVDFGAAFDNYYLGGPPWEIPEVYLAKSPFFRLPDAETPAIIFTGTEDRNVPPHQSWSLFRALQQIGKAPARLVLFPGEPHGLRKVAHQRRKLQEELDWFDLHLFGRPDAAAPPIRQGSLVEGLLGRARAARDGETLGVRVQGVLLPEMIRFLGLEVSRFEITRAQFAAFDPDLPVRAGEENLPVTGVPFERASEYATWLAARTGRPVRLPSAGEMDDLAGAAVGSGNTLDLWAGYTPNPDDARSLLAAVTAAGKTLLLPVGSRAGAGEDPVFDLDGNAAEWAVGEDGGGVAAGPSADRSTDPASRAVPEGAYTGLRVVIGDADGGERDRP